MSPVIPEYKGETPPITQGPGVTVDPRSMTARDKATADFGGSLAELGGTVGDFAIKQKEKQEKTKSAAAYNELDRDAINYMTKLKQEVVGNNVNNIMNYTGNGADKDKSLTRHFMEWYDEQVERRGDGLSQFAQEDYLRKAREAGPAFFHSIGTHQSLQDRQYRADQINYGVDNAIKKIEMDPSDMNVMKQKEIVRELIENLYPGQNVDEYKLHALNRIDLHAKQALQGARVNTELVRLKREFMSKPEYRGDPDAAMLAILDHISRPDYEEDAAKRGLTEEDQRKIESNVMSSYHIQKTVYEQHVSQVLDGMLNRYEDGKIKRDDALKSLRDAGVRGKDVEHFERLMRGVDADKIRARREIDDRNRAIRAEKRDVERAKREAKAAQQKEIKMSFIRDCLKDDKDRKYKGLIDLARIPDIEPETYKWLEGELGRFNKDKASREEVKRNLQNITDFAWKKFPKDADKGKRDEFILKNHGDLNLARSQGKDPDKALADQLSADVKRTIADHLDTFSFSDFGGVFPIQPTMSRPANEWKPNPSDLRSDGSQKGNGFLGPLKTITGKTATEMSIGVQIDGKEVEIPTLVPSLTQNEVKYLLNGNNPTPDIIQKAADHAKKRMKAGKSPFADASETKRLVGWKGGKPVFDVGNGQWQIGAD